MRVTTPPITIEQVLELLTELQDNASILTDKEHSYVVWVATVLADGSPITLENAKTVQAIYSQMINRQYAG